MSQASQAGQNRKTCLRFVSIAYLLTTSKNSFAGSQVSLLKMDGFGTFWMLRKPNVAIRNAVRRKGEACRGSQSFHRRNSCDEQLVGPSRHKTTANTCSTFVLRLNAHGDWCVGSCAVLLVILRAALAALTIPADCVRSSAASRCRHGTVRESWQSLRKRVSGAPRKRGRLYNAGLWTERCWFRPIAFHAAPH